MAGLESLMAGNPYVAAGQAALSTAAGVMQMIQAGKERREANRIQSQLVRPDYQIQQGVLDNQALAESLAGQGLSDQATEAYRSQADRKLGSSINALLMGGGGINNIADLYDTAQQGDMRLAMMEEEVRQKNLGTLMNQNQAMAGETEKQWMINKYAPYQDQKQLVASLRQQANANKWGGLNTIIGGINTAAAGLVKPDAGTDTNTDLTAGYRPAPRTYVKSIESPGIGTRQLPPTTLPSVRELPMTSPLVYPSIQPNNNYMPFLRPLNG